MTITPLPTAPSRSMSASAFIAAANAWVAALNSFVTEMNAAIVDVDSDAAAAELARAAAVDAQAAAELAAMAAVGVSTYVANSSTNLSIGTGSKALTFSESGRTFAVNDQVTLIRRGSQAVRMRGTISAVDNTAKTMTVAVTSAPSTGGSATDWLVVLGALEGTAPQDVAGVAAAFAIVL